LWKNHCILFFTDNEALVSVINKERLWCYDHGQALSVEMFTVQHSFQGKTYTCSRKTKCIGWFSFSVIGRGVSETSTTYTTISMPNTGDVFYPLSAKFFELCSGF
jgi:hypothetical protein